MGSTKPEQTAAAGAIRKLLGSMLVAKKGSSNLPSADHPFKISDAGISEKGLCQAGICLILVRPSRRRSPAVPVRHFREKSFA
jgi:hypothetical protein